MKPTIIRFEPAALTRLQRQAELKGVSLAELVRVVMDNWIDGKYQSKSTIDENSGS
jgi:hypothetical protein